MFNRRTLIASAATLPVALKGATGFSSEARAQQFPTRPITVVAPFAPGGVADLAARSMSASLAKRFGKNVVVENKPGAAGGIGHAYVARAEPDGRTIMVTISSLAVIPEMNRRQQRPATYEMSDFVPLARLFSEIPLLWVKNDAKWQTAEELIADARKRPGEITYGTSGLFGPAHLIMEMFVSATSLKMVHVPYQGGAPATNALLTGQVAVVPSVLSNFKGLYDAKEVRPLLQFGETRSRLFADMPTAIELGYKDVIYVLWTGVFAPAKVPLSAQNTLREAIGAFMKEGAAIEAIIKTGTETGYLDGPDFAQFLQADTARLLAAARAIRLSN